jgi:hypothetical protein
MAVVHSLVKDEPGPALAVVEGLGALFVLTVMVGGLCSLFAWAVVEVVLVLAG